MKLSKLLCLMMCLIVAGVQPCLAVGQSTITFFVPVAPDSVTVSGPAYSGATEFLNFVALYSASDPTQTIGHMQYETSTDAGSTWSTVKTADVAQLSFTSGTLEVRFREANPQWSVVAVSAWTNSANQTFTASPFGSGTVTSVAMTVPSYFTVGGTPITTSGTLAVTAASGQTSHFVLTTGGGTSLALQALVAADIPNLPASQITSGQLALARGGTNADLSATGGTNQFLQQTGSGSAITVATISKAAVGVNYKRIWNVSFPEPTGTGIDTTTVQYAPFDQDGTTSITWTPVKAVLRTESPAAGATTIQFIVSTVGNATLGSGSNLLSSTLSQSGTSNFETTTTTFTGTTVASGNKVAVNWSAVGGTNSVATIEFESN